jgi:hypothetical protein
MAIKSRKGLYIKHLRNVRLAPLASCVLLIWLFSPRGEYDIIILTRLLGV